MDQKIKARWVRALRSGQYIQGSGSLKGGGHYCCLGVLCAVVGANWDKDKDESCFVPSLRGRRIDDGEANYLSKGACRLVGMKGTTQRKLANMNDEGKDFSEIAKYIEKWL